MSWGLFLAIVFTLECTVILVKQLDDSGRIRDLEDEVYGSDDESEEEDVSGN